MSSVLSEVNFIKSTFLIGQGTRVVWLIVLGLLSTIADLIGMAALFPLIIVVSNPEQATQSGILGQFYQVLNLATPRDYVAFLGVLVLSIFFLKNLVHISFLKYQFATLAAWRTKISDALFAGYIRAPYTLILTRSSRFIDQSVRGEVDIVVNGFLLQIINVINLSIVIALVTALLVYIFPPITSAILLIALVVTVVIGTLFQKSLKDARTQTLAHSGEISSVLSQSFDGFKDVRINQKEFFFHEKFSKANEDYSEAKEREIYIQSLPSSVMEMLLLFVIVGVFQLIVFGVDSLAEGVTYLGALAILAFRVLPLLNRASNSVAQITASLPQVVRLRSQAALLKIPTSGSARPSVETPANDELEFQKVIELRNARFRYHGTNLDAVKGASLSIGIGEFVGITGRSGSGKSTLLGLILGLLPSATGAVFVDNRRVTAENLASFYKQVGFVDQNIFLTEGTVAENVAFGEAKEDVDEEKVISSLRKAQLWQDIEQRPAGIHTLVGERGRNLSGGQRQRLAIARALYQDLKIIFLDEASSNLDVATERNFFNFLYLLRGEITVVMIAHRLSTLKRCDKIAFMHEGALMQVASFDDLVDQNPTFRAMMIESDEPTNKDLVLNRSQSSPEPNLEEK